MWCGSVHLVSCHKAYDQACAATQPIRPHGATAVVSTGVRPQHALQRLGMSQTVAQLSVCSHHYVTLTQPHAVLHHTCRDYQHFPDPSLLACLQLEDVQQKVAAAAAVSDAQRRRSCASIAEEDREEHLALSLEGAATPSRQTQSPQPGMPQQQLQEPPPQQQPPLQPEPHSKGLAGSFTAALSNAASGFSFSAGQRNDDHEQPPRQQTPPLSPFALARKFVADREADAMARLKVGPVVWCNGSTTSNVVQCVCKSGDPFLKDKPLAVALLSLEAQWDLPTAT
jgi:hypothetical protein